MKKAISLFLAGALALCGFFVLATGSASAQRNLPEIISQHGYWFAARYIEACYVLSAPLEKIPSERDHGGVFFLVAQNPERGNALEPQIVTGYDFDLKVPVTIELDGRKYPMHSVGKRAWKIGGENALIDAMRAGDGMSVTARSVRGTDTRYPFSLSGVSAALRQIANCRS